MVKLGFHQQKTRGLNQAQWIYLRDMYVGNDFSIKGVSGSNVSFNSKFSVETYDRKLYGSIISRNGRNQPMRGWIMIIPNEHWGLEQQTCCFKRSNAWKCFHNQAINVGSDISMCSWVDGGANFSKKSWQPHGSTWEHQVLAASRFGSQLGFPGEFFWSKPYLVGYIRISGGRISRESGWMIRMIGDDSQSKQNILEIPWVLEDVQHCSEPTCRLRWLPRIEHLTLWWSNILPWKMAIYSGFSH